MIRVKKKDVERFEKVTGQLEGIYEEITTLSKKAPNDGVNKFKLRLVNKILNAANLLLDNKHSRSTISLFLRKIRCRAIAM